MVYMISKHMAANLEITLIVLPSEAILISGSMQNMAGLSFVI